MLIAHITDTHITASGTLLMGIVDTAVDAARFNVVSGEQSRISGDAAEVNRFVCNPVSGLETGFLNHPSSTETRFPNQKPGFEITPR